MRVAVVAPSPVPFVLGGAERLFRGLTEAINERTPHDAELIKLPVRERTLPDLMASYRTFAALDLSHFDLVISTKYPAWMVDHPRHVVYLQHTLRGLYDTYPAGWPTATDSTSRAVRRLDAAVRGCSDDDGPWPIFEAWDRCLAEVGPNDPALAFPGPLARSLVHRLDALALAPARIARYRAISATVIGRPDYLPDGATPRPVMHPTDLRGLRRGVGEGFFTASRLDDPKRIDLLVRAMRFVRSTTTLTIAGTGPRLDELTELAADDPRIRFLGHISDEALVAGYADALAVPYVPLDEDMGLITIEAFGCGTPVITCSDSGGPAELVAHDVSGLVVEPDPAALGDAMQSFLDRPERSRTMGEAGALVAEQITWDRVTDELLTDVRQRPAPARPVRTGGRPSHRRRIVVLSTYPIEPIQHGGQLRSHHLYGALAEVFDVEHISYDAGGPAGTRQLGPGFRQIVVPRGPLFGELEGRLHATLGIPASDIAATLEWRGCTGLALELRTALRRAELAVLAHPYLLPALRAIAPSMPFVYDAHNAEHVMKRQMFTNVTRAALDVGDVIEEVERRAVRGAELVVCCSEYDAAALRSLGPTLADWEVVPNGADVAAIPFVTGDARRSGRARWLARFQELNGTGGLRHVAVFVGSYHPPNLDAAERIARIAPFAPDVLFVLVGGLGRHFDGWRLPRNVLARGFVERAELMRLLSVADVALNPIEGGGGSNLKLAEYFAVGVPVVSSAFGARGFPVDHDVHLLVAPPEALLATVRAAIDDPAAGVRAQRARQLAERELDWEVVGRSFQRAIQRTVDQRGSVDA